MAPLHGLSSLLVLLLSLLPVLLSLTPSVVAQNDERDDFPIPNMPRPAARHKLPHVGGTANGICSDIECREGTAAFSPETGFCVCPQWQGYEPKDPCGFLKCTETSEVFYSSDTNQCICKIKHPTTVLINQATRQVPQEEANVYSVKPYFPDGIISYFIQLQGAPGGFNLNASTTILAKGLEENTELILIPTNLRTRQRAMTDETALILAVTFTAGETIDYHIQLNNGTVLKLQSDKLVHDIDLIDPTQAASLTIANSRARTLTKRDTAPQSRPRGVELIAPGKITASSLTCRLMQCSLDGEFASFNPFQNACFCKTPDAAIKKRSLPARSVSKSYLEQCSQILACTAESQAYYNEESKQCVCVIYREGIKQPIIVSDSTILQRSWLAPKPHGGHHGSRLDARAKPEQEAAVAFKRRNINTDTSILAEQKPSWHVKCEWPINQKNCRADPLGFRCNEKGLITFKTRNRDCLRFCYCGGPNLGGCSNPDVKCSKKRAILDTESPDSPDAEDTTNPTTDENAASDVEPQNQVKGTLLPSLHPKFEYKCKNARDTTRCRGSPLHYSCDNNRKAHFKLGSRSCDDTCGCQHATFRLNPFVGPIAAVGL